MNDGRITRNALNDYLANYLATERFQDYSPNGLQVEGRDTITRVCTAVTASEDIILAAIHQQADALLVHHGFFWSGEPAIICGVKRRRLQPLLQHELNLFAYHLPLDCHPVIGNNACIGRLLQVNDVKSHVAGKTPGLLWSGCLAETLTPQAFLQRCHSVFRREPQAVYANEGLIERVAWCSGAAQDFIQLAAAIGAQAYVSGEISERTYYQAKELGIHYFASGHHATERFGIQALGEHLRQRFGIQHEFLDSDNPV